MRILNLNESLRFLALIVFFTGGVLWSKEILSISDMWDYTLMQTMSLMSGVGLFTVIVTWVLRLRGRKAGLLKGAPVRISRSTKKYS